jgi:hypothetical protein
MIKDNRHIESGPPASSGKKLSQPISLVIESKRDASYKEKDPVDLFYAIDRAFDFEAMEHPFISVTGAYKENTYKTICRDLAGLDAARINFTIGLIQICCLHGEFADYSRHKSENVKGLWFEITDSDIFGTSMSYNFLVTTIFIQIQKSIIVKQTQFSLSNRTKLTIDHVPPGSKFQINFFPTASVSLPKTGNFASIIKKGPGEGLAVEEFLLPNFGQNNED